MHFGILFLLLAALQPVVWCGLNEDVMKIRENLDSLKKLIIRNQNQADAALSATKVQLEASVKSNINALHADFESELNSTAARIEKELNLTANGLRAQVNLAQTQLNSSTSHANFAESLLREDVNTLNGSLHSNLKHLQNADVGIRGDLSNFRNNVNQRSATVDTALSRMKTDALAHSARIETLESAVARVVTNVSLVRQEFVSQLNSTKHELEFKVDTMKRETVSRLDTHERNVTSLAARLKKAEEEGTPLWNSSAVADTCGGLISVTTNLTVIEYKPARGIPAGSRCVWALDSVYEQIDLYVDYARFAVASGLAMIYHSQPYNHSVPIDRYKFPTTNQSTKHLFPMKERHAYLLFSSDGAGGTGFRIRVKGNTPVARKPGFNRYFAETSGYIKSHFDWYADNETSAVVLQPQTNTSLAVKVTAFDSEPNLDYLCVYTLMSYPSIGTSISCEHFITGQTNTFPILMNISKNPKLFLFRTDHSVVYKGYTLEWS